MCPDDITLEEIGKPQCLSALESFYDDIHLVLDRQGLFGERPYFLGGLFKYFLKCGNQVEHVQVEQYGLFLIIFG